MTEAHHRCVDDLLDGLKRHLAERQHSFIDHDLRRIDGPSSRAPVFRMDRLADEIDAFAAMVKGPRR